MEYIITSRSDEAQLSPPLLQHPDSHQRYIMKDIFQNIRSCGIESDHITIVLFPQSKAFSETGIETSLYVSPSGDGSILTSLMGVPRLTMADLQSLLNQHYLQTQYKERAFCINIGKPENGFIEWLVLWGECNLKAIRDIPANELSGHLTRGLLYRMFSVPSVTNDLRRSHLTITQRFQTLVQEKNLTRREQDVLIQALKGKALKVIAADLTISYATVRRYLQRIYEKTGTHSLIQLISEYLIYDDEIEGKASEHAFSSQL